MADDATNLPARRSVLVSMSERYGMEAEAFEATVRATCSPSNKVLTREQLAAFLLVAKEHKLNPLTREIFAFAGQGGGIIPVVSIDGWLRIANEHPAMDGMKIDDMRGEDGKITAVSVQIHRKDRSQPIIVAEYLDECMRPTEPWKKWPARMLRHKATIQAIRYAFGFAGIYDMDEAERIGIDAPVQARVVDESAAQPDPEAAAEQAAAGEMFLDGMAKDLVVREFERMMIDCHTEEALDKVFKKFERMFFNKTTKKVSRNTYDGIVGLRDFHEHRIGEELADLGRTSDEREDEPEPGDEPDDFPGDRRRP